jgi:hypothetical protein
MSLTLIATVTLVGTAAPAADIAPAQKLAAVRAAGLTVKGGKAYDECNQSVDDIQIENVDLNGDKVPEQIVTIGSPCYGEEGSLFAVLRKAPTD